VRRCAQFQVEEALFAGGALNSWLWDGEGAARPARVAIRFSA
jgi:hypothetical protein